MNVELSHIKEPSTLSDHYHTRHTVGSLDDRRGPRESTDEQRQAARLAYRNAARRNIYVITLSRKGPKAKQTQEKDLLHDNARIIPWTQME